MYNHHQTIAHIFCVYVCVCIMTDIPFSVKSALLNLQFKSFVPHFAGFHYYIVPHYHVHFVCAQMQLYSIRKSQKEVL